MFLKFEMQSIVMDPDGNRSSLCVPENEDSRCIFTRYSRALNSYKKAKFIFVDFIFVFASFVNSFADSHPHFFL